VAISAAATPVKPKEFEITPSSGLLQPQSEVEISVEICANTVRKYNTELCVDVEAVQDSLLLLPVTAR
jgi:hydrocephalus-inducing protein